MKCKKCGYGDEIQKWIYDDTREWIKCPRCNYVEKM